MKLLANEKHVLYTICNEWIYHSVTTTLFLMDPPEPKWKFTRPTSFGLRVKCSRNCMEHVQDCSMLPNTQFYFFQCRALSLTLSDKLKFSLPIWLLSPPFNTVARTTMKEIFDRILINGTSIKRWQYNYRHQLLVAQICIFFSLKQWIKQWWWWYVAAASHPRAKAWQI